MGGYDVLEGVFVPMRLFVYLSLGTCSANSAGNRSFVFFHLGVLYPKEHCSLFMKMTCSG
jgi:hypothetical protein